MQGDLLVVAADDFLLHAPLQQARQGLARVGFRRIEKDGKPGEAQLTLVAHDSMPIALCRRLEKRRPAREILARSIRRTAPRPDYGRPRPEAGRFHDCWIGRRWTDSVGVLSYRTPAKPDTRPQAHAAGRRARLY